MQTMNKQVLSLDNPIHDIFKSNCLCSLNNAHEKMVFFNEKTLDTKQNYILFQKYFPKSILKQIVKYIDTNFETCRFKNGKKYIQFIFNLQLFNTLHPTFRLLLRASLKCLSFQMFQGNASSRSYLRIASENFHKIICDVL